MELRIDNQLNEKTEILIRNIIGAVIGVHCELGPGYLEKVYEQTNHPIEDSEQVLRHRGLYRTWFKSWHLG